MSVASKNPFDLLGDDGDSDAPAAPVKTVDKKSMRTAKGNADGEAATSKGPAAPARRGGGFSGSEAAFRDRGVGSDRNRAKSTDDGTRGGHRGGSGARVRGGRGARFPRDRDDRHNKGPPGGTSEKQTAAGWGGDAGEAEMKDEQAGEEIAKKDEKDAVAENNAAADGGEGDAAPAEPEDKSVSFADYLAQQAEKKLALDAEHALKLRKPNEGNKQKQKGTELVKEVDDFISGTGGKVKRERERKTKQLVEIDNRYIEPERARGGRGGRGGGRGEGRGGDFPRGGPRGGARGGAPRGDFRGGRGGAGGRGDSGRGAGGLNPNDEKAFPSLGS